jgi:large subunit ribosomal protein L1
MGKKYLEIAKLVDLNKVYSIVDAVNLVKKTSFTKFDASIDLAIKLNLDTAQAEQNIRGSFSLPHGNGKTSIVLVICNPDEVEAAKKAGADFAGHTEIIDKIKDG